MTNAAVHNVLWTSGWDSTFRVLDLVLVQREPVRPYYVSDPGRQSTPIELRSMDKIRAMAIAHDSQVRQLLEPTRVFRRDELIPDAEASAAYIAMKGEKHLGGQYEWLAWLAEQEDLCSLELGVHKDDRFAKFLGDEAFAAYRRFAFPLLGVTKIEMGEYARKHGFHYIMEQTWFCHQPLRGKPCGRCVPCRQTIEEGMGRRVPPPNFFDHILYFHARRIFRGVRRRVKMAARP